jgi:adenylate cyclase
MIATRRLAAILAADVAGYSRLMGADEEGTHERLQAHLRELVNPKIGEHRGRIVKNTGDGFLAEFASVVDAVRCAAEVQRGMIDREPEVPEERRIRFRIGVNLGDVIVEEHDIFGDGVNVAARLEALAEPGGICISRMVRDNVRDRLAYSFEDMGEQQVKNIARPVRIYALRPGGATAGPATNPSLTTSSSPPTAPRLSIIVLPFTNLSDDREQQYFADGITDDLTTDLSRISGSFVIARNTAFTYKGKPVDVKQVGRELGVRYVLEGSVRRAGHLVRINVQLVDVETGAHLWADRFDTDRVNLPEAQDAIVGRIARTLNVELLEDAGRRIERERMADPDARDLVMYGRALFNRPYSVATFQEAQRAYEQALEKDPGLVDAKIGIASVLLSNMANPGALSLDKTWHARNNCSSKQLSRMRTTRGHGQ